MPSGLKRFQQAQRRSSPLHHNQCESMQLRLQVISAPPHTIEPIDASRGKPRQDSSMTGPIHSVFRSRLAERAPRAPNHRAGKELRTHPPLQYFLFHRFLAGNFVSRQKRRSARPRLPHCSMYKPRLWPRYVFAGLESPLLEPDLAIPVSKLRAPQSAESSPRPVHPPGKLPANL